MTNKTLRHDFASDNTAGMAPEAMQALLEANAGFCPAYGEDTFTTRAADRIRSLLDVDASIYFLPTGTAANAISLAALCRPFESVLAHELAHTIKAEAGAPNYFGNGLAITPLQGTAGRIDPASLRAALEIPDSAPRQCPAALSVSNATEAGTLYTTAALRELTTMARAKGLATHLDGARLANAFAAGFDPKSIRELGIDLLVIGGTKSGMPPSEALVVLDRKLAHRFDSRLKQAGQQPSKSRFLAAPWIGMLADDRWIEYAAHANAMARRLADRMPFAAAYPVETNAVFAHLSPAQQQHLGELGWAVFRVAGAVRFMCSWATTPDSVDELGHALSRLAADS